MKVILAVALLSLVASANAAASTCSVDYKANGAFGLAVSCTSSSTVSLYHVNSTTPSGQDLVLDSAAALASGTGTSFDLTPVRQYALQSTSLIEQHGVYYAYDAVGPTWFGPFTTKCAASASARVPNDPITPPKFVLGKPASGLSTSGTGTPKLTLSFTADRAYNAVAFEFLFNNDRADARCGADFNGGTVANARNMAFQTSPSNRVADGINGNGVWNYTGIADPASCGNQNVFTYVVNDYNNALTNCGWKIDESSTGVTTMKTTVLMTTLEQGVVIRNVLYKKTLESAVQLGIEFQTNVTATTGNLTVFGPQILYSTIIKQTFEPQNSCANWLLLTSVQGPYQLYPVGTSNSFVTPGLDATAVALPNTENAWKAGSSQFRPLADSTDTSALAVTGYNLAFGVDTQGNSGTISNAAKCMTNGPTLALADYSKNDSATNHYDPCNQYWYIRGCKGCTDASFTDVQTLNYNWLATFKVTCHKSFTGSCASPQNETVTVAWSTSSDNYCPRIIDTESSTATLAVYQGLSNANTLPAGPAGSEFNTPQSQFVFGTYSYFEATTTSTIKINDLEIERIGLTAGGASTLTTPDADGARVVFKRTPFTATGWWAANSEATSYSGSLATNGVGGGKAVLSDLELPAPDQGVNFLINKNVTTGSDLTRKCQFQWIWGSKISAASGDFPISTTIQVDLRVRYQDQNNPNAPKSLVLSAKYIPNLQVDTGATATRTVGVQGSTGTTTPVGGGASAEGSAALSTGTIAIGAAAVGGVALIAAATVVAVRRRRKSAEVDTNIESIQLGGGSSQAQLNTV